MKPFLNSHLGSRVGSLILEAMEKLAPFSNVHLAEGMLVGGAATLFICALLCLQ